MSRPTIGIVLFPHAEELDFVGPWEVFTMAQHAAMPNFDPASSKDDPGVYLTAASDAPAREPAWQTWRADAPSRRPDECTGRACRARLRVRARAAPTTSAAQG